MFPRVYYYHIIFVLAVLVLGSCLGKEEEGKRRASGKIRRRHGTPPSYAVPMEPVVHYSQRDPLYHQRVQGSGSLSKEHSEEPNDRLDQAELSKQQAVASDRYEVGSYYPPSYYTQPEPIIEIIFKESNESLPTTPPPPPLPSTKEPIHVFYVKYKKNPNPKGKNDQIIYDSPIPALVPHSSDIQVQDDSHNEAAEPLTYSPPSTTTVRTIIRPDSETYHSSNSGIKVTFGNPEETELEQGSEPRPRVVLPPNVQHLGGALPPNFRPDLTHAGHAQIQHHQFGVRQAPPTQIFNSHPQSHLKPPSSPSGQVQESSYQHSKYAPPTDEQIRQYQQEKLYLYQQSLKQQQNAPPPPSIISPIVPPQQFQQPTSNPPSQLQINFNREKQRLQQGHGQQVLHTQDHRQQQYKHVAQTHPQSKPVPYHQKQSYYNNFQTEQYNKNQNVHYNPQHPVPERNHAQDHSNTNQNSHNLNYEPSHRQNYQPINRPPSVPGLEGIKQDSIQPGISVYERTIVSHESPKDKTYNARPTPNPDINYRNQQSSFQQTYKDGEIVQSVAHAEDHQVTPDYRNVYSALREPPKRSKLPESEDPLQFYPVYSTTSPPSTQKQYSSRISTTIRRNQVTPSLPSHPTTESPIVSQDSKYDNKVIENQGIKENKTAVKVNLAALPDEVPEDLRAQLLSSGILGNADIQILDYDKVGDIPIESLPPEALENFYSAGSAPVPSIVKPDGEVAEPKAKGYSSYAEKNQKAVKPHSKKYGTQLETKVLKDNKYNRYLPLKVNGTEFSMPNSPQLKGKAINSVVVLAPVDYDFIRERDEGEERAGKAIQVEGVRFIAGEALKDLVKNPTRENYAKWLEQERNTPSKHQSVVLLITRRDERDIKSAPEIYMYDVNSSMVSKLRGELSQTFVEVAEANSSNQDLEGIDTNK